jgi:hypothetical protein
MQQMEKLVVSDAEAATLRQRHAEVVAEMIVTVDAMVASGATTQLILVADKLQLLYGVDLRYLAMYEQQSSSSPSLEKGLRTSVPPGDSEPSLPGTSTGPARGIHQVLGSSPERGEVAPAVHPASESAVSGFHSTGDEGQGASAAEVPDPAEAADDASWDSFGSDH